MINKPRGTEDILPEEAGIWQYIESIARKTAGLYGYREIRTPTFESTELFQRGVGDTTDVVQKEMYTFLDKGKRSVTLRPEGTASLVRSYIENSLYANPQPTKLFYIIPCFRYEKPQSGRLREFHQFGIECFGAASPECDAEVIALAHTFLKNAGISNFELSINSIGCPECRKEYNKKLKEYFYQYKDELCSSCLERLEKNPMRIIDCKSEVCKSIAKDAPRIIDYLCEACKTHFEETKKGLENLGIEYKIDSGIVRGLDYYTKTVFEFTSNALGAQSTVCGGGRYSGLVEELGGKPAEGIGFAVGLERLILILKSEKDLSFAKAQPDLYIAPLGDTASKKVQKLVYDLRLLGIGAETDILKRSVKAQMKYADKIGAGFSAVIGDDEIEKNCAAFKNMKTGETKECVLEAEKIAKILSKA